MANARRSTLNLNIGVLGHIDSGKTALCKALSTTASTACFDKNPQSKERGITIDLGFSSFVIDAPEHLRKVSPFEKLQFTLVDCPGHASLIRTIIGGAQIIDLMMLVIDITKGMQTQTAECLVLGEITSNKMLVVLNKIDLLPEDKRQSLIDKMSKKMHKTLEKTKFANCEIVPVAAKPDGPDTLDSNPLGVNLLLESLKRCAYLPERDPSGHFLFSVDHCFSIKGQGTVMTGTVLSGTVKVNDTVEIPSMKVVKKVKSMQMFHQPVEKASQGDRLGICVTQFDPKQLERGLVASCDSLRNLHAAIATCRKIPYHKGSVLTRAKLHVSMGHATLMATCRFFECLQDCQSSFNFEQEYAHLDELPVSGCAYVLLEFEKPVVAPEGCLVIGSRLDADIHANSCRLAFYGRLVHSFEEKNYTDTGLCKLKVFKCKRKEGIVERAVDSYGIVVKNMFKKESNLQSFANFKVTLSTGERGVIEGGFGQSGKTKVRIPNGLQESTLAQLTLASNKKSRGKQSDDSPPPVQLSPIQVELAFKRYVYDPNQKMIQSEK